MVDIYSIRINKSIDIETFNYLLQLVSAEKRERIKKFRFWDDALRSLLGNILARYAVIKKTGYKNNEIKFTENTYSKPFLAGSNHMDLNISHSGSWAMCAAAKGPVGIDVEQIKTIDFDIARKFFTESEYASLMKQDSLGQLSYFYKLWTLKESYIKADGRGLSLPLDSFSISINPDNITLATNNELNSCVFRCFNLDEQHIASVCSAEREISEKIEEVSVEDLVRIVV